MSLNREDVAVPVSRCPACDYRMDAASCTTDETARPKPGDLSLCLKCGVCLTFGPDLRLRPTTEIEIRTLPAAVQRELARTTAAIIELQRKRRQQ